MRRAFVVAAACALAPVASADGTDQVTALLVRPIQDAQVVRGTDAMDHVEYDLLVVSVFPEPITLSRLLVLDPAGKELMRIEGAALAAVTQPLFAHTATPVVGPSVAVAVEVDLILPPDTAPERLASRLSYALEEGSALRPMFASLEVEAPAVVVNRKPGMVIQPPLRGKGWFASSGCCKPNLHRDLRVALDGVRITTPETFDIDFARVRNGRIFAGDGSRNEQHYAFGESVLAVAEGTVVSVRDGAPDAPPNVPVAPERREDYGGNHVILQIAPSVFATYVHLRPGSLRVKVGEAVKAGAELAEIGNSGPSRGPHLHFGLHDKADLFAARSLPFVFDRFTLVGSIDFDESEPDDVRILPDAREVRNRYPLYGSVLDSP